jgi:membrane protein implicated in regulation of membrane protease activity
MKKPGWPPSVLLRYALLQVPSLALLVLILISVRKWMDLPAWFVWGLVAFWVAKDVILFHFVWRAFDRDSPGGHSIVCAQGIVEKPLAPLGYIRVRGELWQAERVGGGGPIDRGETVRVRGIRGLTLLVQPGNEESTE